MLTPRGKGASQFSQQAVGKGKWHGEFLKGRNGLADGRGPPEEALRKEAMWSRQKEGSWAGVPTDESPRKKGRG